MSSIIVFCSSSESLPHRITKVPAGFPDVVHPPGNEFSLERWNLGKKLFYDPILSKDSTTSCASCHNPDLAFSDSVAFSKGVDNRLGTRNAPSLNNVAYHPYFTRDGGVHSLEQQVLIPIQEHVEMDFNILKISDRLIKSKIYSKMSEDAYGKYPDSEVITKSIACFERTLISGESKYDSYVNGQKTALSSQEKRGKSLFFSDRANCSQCHSGFNFSDYSFQNNGLYLNYTDSGRMRITENELDKAKFKVPSLRNVEYTAPYMHDGSFKTLEEVVEHYSSGIRNHTNLSPKLSNLHLNNEEKSDLVAFLKCLSDQNFITNEVFKKQ